MEIDRASTSLHALPGKIGAHLRENEWLSAIKQRSGIPGGVAEFDLPAYHYWLNREPVVRQHDLQHWLEPLLPIRSGLAIILGYCARTARARARPQAAECSS